MNSCLSPKMLNLPLLAELLGRPEKNDFHHFEIRRKRASQKVMTEFIKKARCEASRHKRVEKSGIPDKFKLVKPIRIGPTKMMKLIVR